MRHVKIVSKTIRDNTGLSNKSPVLLIEQGGEVAPLWSLHEYFMSNRLNSNSRRTKLIQIVGLLLDYMDANANCFSTPLGFFESFTEAIYSGTINEEGYDPSGLYWLPKRVYHGRDLLRLLSDYSDWMHDKYGTVQLNPWRRATKYEERLKWAALINKSNKSFLGHLDSSLNMAETARQARSVVQRRVPSGSLGSPKIFPQDKIQHLLWEGFKARDKENHLNFLDKYNWRDIAITILLHGGGVRINEPFHVWVHDVIPDPSDPKLAVVRIYYPSEGSAPKDLKTPTNGRYVTNREAYLRIKYGLLPRNKLVGELRYAGWKNPKMSNANENYMQIHWFPNSWGYLFMQVWKMYMAQRIRERIPDTHPFLFVAFKGQQKGEMYTMEAYEQSHARAVKKIGLTVGKMLGTTVHRHRHAYGQRETTAELEPKIIQAGLHHKSIDSQKCPFPNKIDTPNSLYLDIS